MSSGVFSCRSGPDVQAQDMAAPHGFEPWISAPKADVLPLHHGATWHGQLRERERRPIVYSRSVDRDRQAEASTGKPDGNAIIGQPLIIRMPSAPDQ